MVAEEVLIDPAIQSATPAEKPFVMSPLLIASTCEGGESPASSETRWPSVMTEGPLEEEELVAYPPDCPTDLEATVETAKMALLT